MTPNQFLTAVPQDKVPVGIAFCGRARQQRISSNPRILFVDNEGDVLDSLSRMFRKRAKDWDMHFANSCHTAIDLLTQMHFDILITDMKMPILDGGEILRYVAEHSPETIRYVLSGHADDDSLSRCAHLIHRFLSKPATHEDIEAAIKAAIADDSPFEDYRVKRFVNGLASFPSSPTTYAELVRCSESESFTLAEASRIASRDPAVASKILQLVNSSFFRIAQKVSSVDIAVRHLGLENIKRLAIAASVFRKMESSSPRANRFALQLWSHSMECADLSAKVAKAFSLTLSAVSEAFTAGLLHDIGKLLLLESDEFAYLALVERSKKAGQNLSDLELQIFGFHHGQLGAYILKVWGLPDGVVSAVRQHHDTKLLDIEPFTSAHACSAANALLSESRAADIDSNSRLTAIRTKLSEST
jgi:putative nucleotidyltransferase with HDIG domain